MNDKNNRDQNIGWITAGVLAVLVVAGIAISANNDGDDVRDTTPAAGSGVRDTTTGTQRDNENR
jgi:hypothetical protein